MENQPNRVINLDDFAAKTTNAKSPIQTLVKQICREVNRQKLNYDQLRYVFRQVRTKCEVNPPSKRRKLRELPSTAELTAFFAAIDDPHHRLIFELLLGTGLRVSETVSLRVDRIDLAANSLFVSCGKGGKDRIVIFGNRLREKLELYLKGRNNIYVFESIRNKKFSSRRIEQLCSHYRTRAAIQSELTPHVFRHLFFTRLAEQGISEERRMILAGHSQSQTQRIYSHLSGGGLKDEIVTALDKVADANEVL